MKEINLEDIANSSSVFRSLMGKQQQNAVIFLMRKACKQTIELCAENAETKYYAPRFDAAPKVIIDKQSILNTEKQII